MVNACAVCVCTFFRDFKHNKGLLPVDPGLNPLTGWVNQYLLHSVAGPCDPEGNALVYLVLHDLYWKITKYFLLFTPYEAKGPRVAPVGTRCMYLVYIPIRKILSEN